MGMCLSGDKSSEPPPPEEETGFKSSYVKARVKERSEAREREALLRQQQQQMQGQTTSSSQGSYQAGGSITRLQAQTSGLASDMARAREGLDERGQRLRQVEDVTIRMGAESKNLGKTTSKLKSKYN
ncbi:PREDICTED: syntaxin-binding protein 5-like [Branchiostoma belcheri]|uniref:Syntaxin-binding protein 5-like n=1 Tax=Branchiostoma belcheri TaxID=7741 RepID=A0A6P4YDK1_BRABE|nr:PREDICTED: syntaxin-binding protein 5-like [Branchiostoma belcheri]